MKILIDILDQIKNKPTATNIFTPKIPYLEQDMENQRIKNIVVPMLSEIEKEIDDMIFNKIKSCNSIEDAYIYFELLHKIQGVLGRLWIVENIALSRQLQAFVHDCERLDDPWLRTQLFSRIKQGLYKYDFM